MSFKASRTSSHLSLLSTARSFIWHPASDCVLTPISVAFAFSIPVLAATLAFVTYTHVTPGFDVAVIFASLSLFQVQQILTSLLFV